MTRRKSSALEHLHQQSPSRRMASTPLSTPERPLLCDFNSASASTLTSPERCSSAMHHIYVELDGQGGHSNEAYFQPIHIPILAGHHQQQQHDQQLQQQPATMLMMSQTSSCQPLPAPRLGGSSSNSSQSSGYYSSPGTRAKFGHHLQSAASSSPPIKTIFRPTLAAGDPNPRPVGGTARGALDIQDSQFI